MPAARVWGNLMFGLGRLVITSSQRHMVERCGGRTSGGQKSIQGWENHRSTFFTSPTPTCVAPVRGISRRGAGFGSGYVFFWHAFRAI